MIFYYLSFTKYFLRPELNNEATVKEILTVQKEGNRIIEIYNLNVMILADKSVNSHK